MTDARKCAWCSDPLPADSANRRKYCPPPKKCKTLAKRDRHFWRLIEDPEYRARYRGYWKSNYDRHRDSKLAYQKDYFQRNKDTIRLAKKSRRRMRRMAAKAQRRTAR